MIILFCLRTIGFGKGETRSASRSPGCLHLVEDADSMTISSESNRSCFLTRRVGSSDALLLRQVFWLPGFTYPTGFLTALLQTTARKNGLAIDSLSWEFPILNQSLASITSHPKEGAYLNGFFLEGARWDADQSCLGEPFPMELTSSMPIIHFKPTDSKKKVCVWGENCVGSGDHDDDDRRGS
jgi:hypothetical protein